MTRASLSARRRWTRIRALASGRPARGFTVIEVLIAMTLMMIGAAAVITMQKTAIQANLEARKTDEANSIARMWVERLRRDAMQWTYVAGNGSATTINVAAPHLIQQTSWAFPTVDLQNNTGPVMSPGFDILGRDLDRPYLDQSNFCVNIQIMPLTTATTPSTPTLIVRADVRVLWPRGISGAPPSFCTIVDQGLNTGTDTQLYHSIYVTTALSVNASQPQ